jgi:hypothetical protein
MEDVRAARRSEAYVERILWPRLSTLVARPLRRPPARRRPGLAAQRDQLADAEREP